MISFENACEKAYKEKMEYFDHGINAGLIRALDCGDFYTFQIGLFDEYGNQYYPMGGKHDYDIRKSDGAFIDFPPYFPNTEYGDLIDNAQEIEIPEKYRS